MNIRTNLLKLNSSIINIGNCNLHRGSLKNKTLHLYFFVYEFFFFFNFFVSFEFRLIENKKVTERLLQGWNDKKQLFTSGTDLGLLQHPRWSSF